MQLESTEMTRYRAQAREMAVKAARDKASAMAGAVGQSIGSALEIQEAEPLNSALLYSRNVVSNVSNSIEVVGSEDDSLPMAGRIPISARVIVVFELK